MEFRLSKSLAQILLLLMENKVVTARMIEQDHKISRDGKVAIHRLRRYLEGTEVKISSQREVGYWLEPDVKTFVTAKALKGINTNFASKVGQSVPFSPLART
jgi:hypothetical protein